MATGGGESGAPAEAAPAKAKTTAAVPVGPVVEDLPRSIVRRVVKDKLNQLSSTSRKKGKAVEGGEGEEGVAVQKDALLAFAEGARIFIHYLSATANDICRESKRQTINAEDVLKALEEIEFPEFVEPLKASLEDFRRKNAVKKSGAKAKGVEKKRKAEEELPAQTGENETDAPEEIDQGVEDADDDDNDDNE